MNYADEIKRAVSMRDVCGMYGIAVNKAGFALCPFHSDRKPSMKVYDGARGFHCYVCDAGSSVIDFVQRYFNLSFADSLSRINTDFRLGLPIGETLSDEEKRRAEIEARKRRAEAARRAQEREKVDREYHDSLDRYCLLDRVIRRHKPTSPDTISEDYAYAVREIDKAKYRLDEAEIMLYNLEHRRIDTTA